MLKQTICTNYSRTHEAKDNCTCDFGGAFAVKLDEEKESYVMVGIVRQHRGCIVHDADYPEVYLKVAQYVSWINQTIKDNV